MKVTIDKNKCIGCGACVGIAPEVFKLNEETNKSEVQGDPAKVSEEILKKAISSCPVGAIKVLDE